MDVYAMESALLQTQRLLTDRGIDATRVQADITRVFTRDAASHVERRARAVASETEDDKFKCRCYSCRSAISGSTFVARRAGR
jgi:Acyl-CoA dehydrogenase, C-terminal domain